MQIVINVFIYAYVYTLNIYKAIKCPSRTKYYGLLFEVHYASLSSSLLICRVIDFDLFHLSTYDLVHTFRDHVLAWFWPKAEFWQQLLKDSAMCDNAMISTAKTMISSVRNNWSFKDVVKIFRRWKGKA